MTGAGGFVGGHLLTYLQQHAPQLRLHGTLLNSAEQREAITALGCECHILDLRDASDVRALLADVRPTRIYHLAGQAFVPRSFVEPWETIEINVRGTLNLLQAARELNLDARILVISSADVYGAGQADGLPLTESAAFNPSSPYSVSKIAQDMLALQFARAHQLDVIRARPFNHIGPNQSTRFAVSDWASQIAQAEAGLREPLVSVGNLSAARDFTDVRDVVRAYVMCLESGQRGEVFNVCSGKPYTMRHILDTLIGFARVPITVQVDPARVRPIEIPELYGSYAHLQARTGWQPEVPLEQSLHDVLSEWREKIASAPINPS